MKKALLKTGYRCNNNCVFCHSAPHRPLEGKNEDLEEKIDRARRLGIDMIVFSGGEPTLRPNLLRLAHFAVQQGLSLGLVTNGRMLSYPSLIEKMRQTGLSYVQVTLCGPDEELHNRHVRADAFSQSVRAIELLHDWIEKLVINVVVTAWNMKRLAQIRSLAEAFPRAGLKFSLVEPEGNALENFSSLVPPLKDAAREITRQLVCSDGRQVGFDGLPLCLVPDSFWKAESTLREEGFWLISEAFESDWYPIDEMHRGHAPICAACSVRRRCRGVFRTYLERKGWAELRPLEQPVPNSYVFGGNGEKIAAKASCPWKGQIMPPLAPREIWVRQGRTVEKFSYNGRDFSDTTLDYTQRQLGQLYLRSGRSEDLSRSVQPLARSTLCRRCPRWRLCGGLWLPARSAFAAFEKWLGRKLQTLSGRVLDIGCGRAPYIKYLKPAIRKGQLIYHGIDPHKLPKSSPGLQLEKVSFADFATCNTFDYLLFIRSINHVGKIPATLRLAKKFCSPKGRLILVEDVVYGLVESRKKKLSSSPGFEHRINLHLDEAIALCKQAGFRPLFWKAPEEATVPCWYLECES